MDVAELVLAARRGDADAFTELYRTHVRAVYFVVRQNAGGEDSFDIVQEVFLRALQRIGDLREPERFGSWLLTIARYAAIDSRRRASRVDLLDDDAIESLTAKDRSPVELSELRDLSELVWGCVAGLSARDATAVVLVTQFDYTIEEVSRVLNISHGAAKVALHRARRRLRNTLALNVLVRHEGTACPELKAIGFDDPVRAARHVQACTLCITAARGEIDLYGLVAKP